MVTAYVMDIPQSSHDTTSIINFVRKLYTKSATYFLRIKFALLALILVPVLMGLSIPVLLVVWAVFKISKIRLKYALKKEINITFSSYKGAKEIQESLKEDLVLIEGVINLLSDKSVFFSTIFIGDIKDTYKILSDFQSNLDISLSKLSVSHNDGLYFKVVSETNLWNNRTQAYQYKL